MKCPCGLGGAPGPPGAMWYPGVCGACLRKLTLGTMPGGAIQKIPLCAFYVDAPKIRGADAPDLTRDWRTCPKGHGTVCLCKDCGPQCRDYLPEP